MRDRLGALPAALTDSGHHVHGIDHLGAMSIVVDASSNLGLRPPRPGTVPGCYKLAGALRDHGLLARLGAREGGVATPPRYDRGDWAEGDGVFNAAAIARYSWPPKSGAGPWPDGWSGWTPRTTSGPGSGGTRGSPVSDTSR